MATFTGASGHDSAAYCSASNDRMYGGAGNDSLMGVDTEDAVSGEAGHDTPYGSTGDNLLFGRPNDEVNDGIGGRPGPGRDVWVWPQHGMLVGDVLVRARHLAEVGLVWRACPRDGEGHHHFLLPRHALVPGEGQWIESMCPAPVAPRAPGPEARGDLLRGMRQYGPAIFGDVPVMRV